MVTIFEGCPETANIARQQFQKFGMENIELKIGRFEEVLEEILKREEWKVESGETEEESGEKTEKREEWKEKSEETERGKWRVGSGEYKPRTTETAET